MRYSSVRLTLVLSLRIEFIEPLVSQFDMVHLAGVVYRKLYIVVLFDILTTVSTFEPGYKEINHSLLASPQENLTGEKQIRNVVFWVLSDDNHHHFSPFFYETFTILFKYAYWNLRLFFMQLSLYNLAI
jgi:hypothetical protein